MLIKTAADAESAIRRVMLDATEGVVRDVASIHEEAEAVPVRPPALATLVSIDLDTLIDRTIKSIEEAESEVEQFQPRLERALQAMEDALDKGEYQARSLVIRPALAGDVDECIKSVRAAEAAKVKRELPRLAALQAERKNLASYRTTIAEKRQVVQHYEDGARRACLALAGAAPKVG